MTYHIRSQADWQACIEVLAPGDTVNIHTSFYTTWSDYQSLHGITFIGVGPTPTITIIDDPTPPQPPPPPSPRQYYLVSPVFCQEVAV